MKIIPLFLIFLFTTLFSTAQTVEIQNALNNNRYNDALELLDKEPITFDNLLLKAFSHEKLYNYPKALSIYEKLEQQQPTNVNLIISMAECATQAGDLQQSLRGWIRADSLTPDNLFIQNKLAMAHYRNNNWTETISASQKVFKTDSIPLLLRMVGDAYLYTSNTDSAISFYTKAIEKNPSDYLAVIKLGNVYHATKDYESVIALTDEYLKTINPNMLQIGQLNGMANYSAKNYEKATDRLTKNVALGDTSFVTNYYLGLSFYGQDLYFEAAERLSKAYEQNSNDVNLIYYLGTALINTKDFQRGIAVLEQGVSKIEDIYALLYKFDRSFADAYQRSGDYTKAIKYYTSAFERQPDDNILLFSIARTYDTMKDYKNAITFYKQLLKTAPSDLDIANIALAEEEKMTTKNFHYILSYRRLSELQEILFMQSKQK